MKKQISSTHRELVAVKYVLDSFWEILRNQSVQVNIDNSSACRILSAGSAKLHLQDIAIDVFNFCSKFNIKLIPQWIPREQNELPYHYSRIKDTENWSIDNFYISSETIKIKVTENSSPITITHLDDFKIHFPVIDSSRQMHRILGFIICCVHGRYDISSSLLRSYAFDLLVFFLFTDIRTQ